MNTISDKELENIVGGITGTANKKSTYYDQEDLVCNSCYFEPSKSGLKCLKGDTCPKCHKGTLIYAKG